MGTVSDGTNVASYYYVANSPLAQQISFAGNVGPITTTWQYDYLNRLQMINTSAKAVVVASFAYQYNSANQRTQTTLADNSYWSYQYDSLGQLSTGKKHWADTGLAPGQQYEYTHDDIGNRTLTKAGGDQGGAGLRPAFKRYMSVQPTATVSHFRRVTEAFSVTTLCKSIRLFLCVFACFIAVYLAAFAVLMNPNEPARDDDLKIIYHSSFRWGIVGSHRDLDGAKTDFVWPSRFNKIFAPVDLVLDVVAPQHQASN